MFRRYLTVALLAGFPVACRPDGPAPAPARVASPAPKIAPQTPPVPKVAAIPPGHSPDPNYWPKPGDEAILWHYPPIGSDCPIAFDRIAYDAMMKAYRVGDTDGFNELAAGGRVASTPAGTQVLVVDVRGEGDEDPVEVRIRATRGPGDAAWVPRVCVARLTPD